MAAGRKTDGTALAPTHSTPPRGFNAHGTKESAPSLQQNRAKSLLKLKPTRKLLSAFSELQLRPRLCPLQRKLAGVLPRLFRLGDYSAASAA